MVPRGSFDQFGFEGGHAMRCLRVLVVICGGLVGGVLSADESLKPEPLGQDVEVQAVEIPTTDAAVRQAVSRSLPFLEKEGVAWMHEVACRVIMCRFCCGHIERLMLKGSQLISRS
jgi:hypothetical protein